MNNLLVADEIIKLKRLLDAGVLTQEEFDNQKKKLLSDEDDEEIIEPEEEKMIDPTGLKGAELKKAKEYNRKIYAKKYPGSMNASTLSTPYNQVNKPKKNPKLIKSGVMCPKCYSQDVMVLTTKKSISGVLVFGLSAKNHPTMVCKTCGNQWKV